MATQQTTWNNNGVPLKLNRTSKSKVATIPRAVDITVATHMKNLVTWAPARSPSSSACEDANAQVLEMLCFQGNFPFLLSSLFLTLLSCYFLFPHALLLFRAANFCSSQASDHFVMFYSRFDFWG